MIKPKKAESCQMTAVGQCCCNCIYQIPVREASSEPKENNEHHIVSGFLCSKPFEKNGFVHGGWPEHSAGCVEFEQLQPPRPSSILEELGVVIIDLGPVMPTEKRADARVVDSPLAAIEYVAPTEDNQGH
jgi:hypothetical protein